MMLCIFIIIRPLPSSFGKRIRSIQGEYSKKTKSKVHSYDRIIICLPNFMRKGDTVSIPRSLESREFLGRNKLIGRIHLDSNMEDEIFDEIRSVFQVPFGNSSSFQFEVLQAAGGSSKMLTVPATSSSFKWTANSIVSKSPKTPIYIMAIDELKVTSLH